VVVTTYENTRGNLYLNPLSDSRSDPGAVLPLEETRCGWETCSIPGSWTTLGRCIYYLSCYYYLTYLSPQDSPSSSS
jgi:hypothetical protein